MDLRALARKQLADYDRHQPGLSFASDAPDLSVEQAYELQMEVARLREERGETIAGYKIGCLSPAVQSQLGLDRPVFGHLYATELHRSGAFLDPTRYAGLAVEGELAVRLGAAGAIVSAFVVIELHNCVFRRLPPTPQEVIANNAIHAGVVLPAREIPVENPEELREAAISVWKNDRRLGTAVSSLKGIPLLAEHLARFGRKLEQGHVVLTGSPLPLYPVTDGDAIEVRAFAPGETVTATIAKR